MEALRSLRPLGAVLLESRTNHPGARWSYVAFDPLLELRLHAANAEVRRPPRDWTPLEAAPWTALETLLSVPSPVESSDPPFCGGWIGFLSHEASSWLLDTPVASPAPPARPAFPWGFFRFYTTALAINHTTGEATFLAAEFSEHADGSGRIERARNLLETPSPPAAHPPRAQGPPHATLSRAAFVQGVQRLKELIRNGDCFQANLTTSYAFAWDQSPSPEELITLYDAYASANPGAWGAFFDAPGCTLLSSSPELLAEVHAGHLRLRPIAGTRPRGPTVQEDERRAEELRADPKERAEHAMLVDLARNDAARVARPATVRVTHFAGIERYRHVMHLVSEVEAEVGPRVGAPELLRAVFPGGTVTGCPKRRAVQRIAEHEGGPRGPYTGTLGYVSLNGSTQWNLLIRTLVATPTHLLAHAGCGIVEGSRPEREVEELEAKARAQVEAALGQSSPALPEARCGTVEAGPAWSPPVPQPRNRSTRVLLIDCEDSFVHTLADYFHRLGAETHVHSAHEPAAAAWDVEPTHLLLSPGPGRPEDFPMLAQHLARARERGIPVLGVCLGHQALAQQAGVPIERHPETVHGKASSIRRTPEAKTDPLLGAWRGQRAGRYHSLVAARLTPLLVPLANLEDGTNMAFRYADRPWWGLQFHPESLLTEDGLTLLRAFLEASSHG